MYYIAGLSPMVILRQAEQMLYYISQLCMRVNHSRVSFYRHVLIETANIERQTP